MLAKPILARVNDRFSGCRNGLTKKRQSAKYTRGSRRYECSAERAKQKAHEGHKKKKDVHRALCRVRDAERACESRTASRAQGQVTNLSHQHEPSATTERVSPAPDVETIGECECKQRPLLCSATRHAEFVEEQQRENEGERATEKQSTSILYQVQVQNRVKI